MSNDAVGTLGWLDRGAGVARGFVDSTLQNGTETFGSGKPTRGEHSPLATSGSATVVDFTGRVEKETPPKLDTDVVLACGIMLLCVFAKMPKF